MATGDASFNEIDLYQAIAATSDTQVASGARPNRLGKIDPTYVAADFANGVLPRVIFDGETSLSVQRYNCLGNYWPHPGERVVMMAVSNTYVVLGPVNGKVMGGTRIGDSVFKFRTTDSAGLASSTTLQDDDVLAAPVDENASYYCFICGRSNSSAGGDIKTNWSLPSDVSFNMKQYIGGAVAVAAAPSDALIWSSYATSVTLGYPGLGGNYYPSFYEWGIFTTVSSGMIVLQWAQNTSNVTATILGAGSFLWLTRVA